MEMAYREGGGLLLPTLATEEEAAANLGPFALMRDEYLRSSKPELRADLLAQGALAKLRRVEIVRKGQLTVLTFESNGTMRITNLPKT